MDLLTYILVGIVVVGVAVLSMRQRNSNQGKSLEQRRDEVYSRYEQRMEEFRTTEMKDACAPKDE